MKLFKKLIGKIICLFLLLGIIGCGGGPKPKNMLLNFKTGPELNPDDNGKPLSVRVRVYSLKGKDRFEGARFEELWEKDRKILEEDFVERKNEYVLQPQTEVQKPLTLEESRQESYIGVIANFRKQDHNYWRAIVPTETIDDPWFGPPLLRVVMDQYQLRLTNEE